MTLHLKWLGTDAILADEALSHRNGFDTATTEDTA